MGRIPHEKMIEYYQQSDLFVFPSVWEEPFGMPVIEAMAMELPVIATRGGAFPEIVEEEKTGLLVKKGDANALAEAILRLLRNENLSQEMAKAGRKRVAENFSWEQLSENLFAEYRKLLKIQIAS